MSEGDSPEFFNDITPPEDPNNPEDEFKGGNKNPKLTNTDGTLSPSGEKHPPRNAPLNDNRKAFSEADTGEYPPITPEMIAGYTPVTPPQESKQEEGDGYPDKRTAQDRFSKFFGKQGPSQSPDNQTPPPGPKGPSRPGPTGGKGNGGPANR